MFASCRQTFGLTWLDEGNSLVSSSCSNKHDLRSGRPVWMGPM